MNLTALTPCCWLTVGWIRDLTGDWCWSFRVSGAVSLLAGVCFVIEPAFRQKKCLKENQTVSSETDQLENSWSSHYTNISLCIFIKSHLLLSCSNIYGLTSAISCLKDFCRLLLIHHFIVQLSQIQICGIMLWIRTFVVWDCGDVSLSLKESSFSTFPIEEIEEKKVHFYPGDFRFLIVQYINR